MTAASIAAALVERGLDPRERDAKRSLFDRALGAFRSLDAREPAHVSWVPGRLEVFGKHTDYAGGRTLTAALPKGFAFAAAGRTDDVVRVLDARSGETARLPGGDGSPTGWRQYVHTVVRRLKKNFPDAPLGADIAFASDLPRAAGMSSSSALVVGIANALVNVSGIACTEAWRDAVATPLDAASYFACIENGSRFRSLDGDAGVGTHGGSEDHATMLTARAGRLTAYAFVPARSLRAVPLQAAWRFAIAESGVVAEKTGAARDRYNRLSAGVRLLVELWNAHEPPALSLAAALGSRADAVERLRDRVRRAATDGWTAGALERRLDHFIREDARIEAALDAVARDDRQALGELSSASQADAESLLANQIPETIALAASARERGAFAACSFGAGFGGSVWALVDAEEADAFAARWHPSAFVASPGPLLTVL